VLGINASQVVCPRCKLLDGASGVKGGNSIVCQVGSQGCSELFGCLLNALAKPLLDIGELGNGGQRGPPLEEIHGRAKARAICKHHDGAWRRGISHFGDQRQETCKNGGVVNSGTCTCSCAEGYFGPDCSDSLKLSWSAYNSASLTASFTLSSSLASFYAVPANQRANVLQRYSDPSRGVWCSNCNQGTLTSGRGSVVLANENLKLGFKRPNFEHCYSVLLSRGTNEFGIALSPVRVDFPCFYLRPSATLPGGYCVDGGTPITSKKDPMYEYQCNVPAAAPVSTCRDIVHASICSYWKGRGYCAQSNIYFPYVAARCALTCGLRC